MTAACIGLKLPDQPVAVITLDEDFTQIINDYPSMTEEQIGLLALLGVVFNIRTNRYWAQNMPWINLGGEAIINIGQLVDSTSDPQHPTDSYTLFTYTKDSLKDNFKQEYPQEYENNLQGWAALIDNTSFEDMTTLMNQYYPGTFVFNSEGVQLAFTSVTPAELEAYNQTPDRQGQVFPAYEDAFEWLKASIGQQATGYNKPNSTPFALTSVEGREYVTVNSGAALLVFENNPSLPGGLPQELPDNYINIALPSIEYKDSRPS